MFEYRGTLRSAQGGPLIGLAAQVLLLAALAATVGLGLAGWLVGLACGLAMDAALAYNLLRNRSERIGPAGWVTLVRATLAVGVAALAADSFGSSAQTAPWWRSRPSRWCSTTSTDTSRGAPGRSRPWARAGTARSTRS